MRTKAKIGRLKKRSRLPPSLPHADAHLQDLILASSSWYYWEQDEHFRFTQLTGSVFERSGIDPQSYIGKTRWELNAVPVGDNGEWDAHKAVLDARQPFADFLIKNVSPKGRVHFISTSGQPVFDANGIFKGYRGITKTITERIWRDRRLAIEHAVTRLLAEAASLADALPAILRTICETLHWECGAYWEVDARAGVLRCLETWGIDAPGVGGFLAATKRSSPLLVDASARRRRLLAQSEPAWIDNIVDDKSFERARAARQAGLRSAFAFPIKADAQVIGVMEFYSREAAHEADSNLLEGAAYVGSGIGQFCQRKQAEHELLRFRAAMDMSLDEIYLTDPNTLRFLDVNETACRVHGYTREEMLRIGPRDLWAEQPQPFERIFDEVIAKGAVGTISEGIGTSRDGRRRCPIEARRRAFRLDNKWIVVTVTRDISERKLAERASRRLAGMYAALGATNEAIIRSTSPAELYQRVCDAAVHGGKFIVAAIMIPDADTAWAHVAAITGENAEKLRALRISVDAAMPEGRGLVGTAFRTVKPCVSNDHLNDERTQPWRREAKEMGIASAAAFPLVRNNRAIGVLLLDSGEKEAFDNEVVALLERIAENVVFALDNFEREAERHRAEESTQRSTRMYAALSATNEAIIRAKSPEELYQRVCDAAVHGGKFLLVGVFLADPASPWARLVATTGAGTELLRQVRISFDDSLPEGKGMIGVAFRTHRPSISNDYLNDERSRPWRGPALAIGINSTAAIPLIKAGHSIGGVVIYSSEKNAFDDEIVALLSRMAENVAFALDNFEHQAEREHAEERLHTSEEKHRAVLENMSEGYFEVDLAGNYVAFNDALAHMHGCTRDELLGTNYRRYYDAETVQRVYQIYHQVYRTGEPVGLIEWPFKRKDNTIGIWEQSVQLILDAQAKPIGFRGVTRDITNRRQAEEALRASEEKYRTILEGIEDAYYEVDLKGDLVFFNTAFGRLLGYSESELTGMNNRRYQTPEVSEQVYKTFNEVYRTGVPTMAYDWEMVRSDGGKVLVEGSVHLIKDALGEPGGFRGILRDVGARRQMEQALRASEERFRSLTDLSSDWFWEQDAEFRFTKFEGKGVAEDRYDPASAVLGKLSWELSGIVPESAPWEAHRATLLRHESFRDFEYSYRDPKGNLYYVSVNGTPVFDKEGKLVGYRGTSRDITERKHEERLLALEHAVTRALAGTDSTAKTLQAVLRSIGESERWDSGGFWRIDEPALSLRLTIGWNAPDMQTQALEFYKNAMGANISVDSLLGTAWKTKKPLWVADITNDPRSLWHQRMSRLGEQSTFYFPVMTNVEAIGVFAFTSRAIREPDERLLRTVGVIGNQVGQFLQRKQAERVLRESEARFRALTELSSDWYWEQDIEIRFTRVESRREDADGTRQYLLGKRPWETGYDIDGGWEAHCALVAAHKPYRDAVMHRLLPDGSARYISVTGEPMVDERGQFLGYRGVTREITEQKLAQARIQYLATHDELTDLPNRAMFSQLLNAAMHSARRYGRELAVLFIDLDRFKVINDTLGHDAGDILLQEIAARLKQILRASDVVARLGGDEFVVLLPEVHDTAEVATVARKILSAIIRPVILVQQECRITGSIGISMCPTDAKDEQTLMKNADMAMYLAKEEGKNNFQFYSAQVKAQSLERLALETNLRRALERDEFSIHYQAKLDLRTNRITGVEALLRWNSPELGSVSPAQFIPLAEEIGLIVPIGRWVMQTACAQNVAWQRQGLAPIRMAVNLSARQFTDVDLLRDIAEALRESGMRPDLLELEITEGMVIHNPERVINLLNTMKRMGVRLAIDDFGTGYSSLGQLKTFPIDTLKVDRSFIRDIPQHAEDNAITKAIIAMGKTLGLTVVAEGVETQAQADFLREHACDEMQGYYFSKPIAADQFAELLREHAAVPVSTLHKAPRPGSLRNC